MNATSLIATIVGALMTLLGVALTVRGRLREKDREEQERARDMDRAEHDRQRLETERAHATEQTGRHELSKSEVLVGSEFAQKTLEGQAERIAKLEADRDELHKQFAIERAEDRRSCTEQLNGFQDQLTRERKACDERIDTMNRYLGEMRAMVTQSDSRHKALLDELSDLRRAMQ
jgi:chromosome segregation ATPase